MFDLNLCDLVPLLCNFLTFYSMIQSTLLLMSSILIVLLMFGRVMDRSNIVVKIAVLLIGGIAADVDGLVAMIPMTC